jgi:hypothetical protein
MYKKDGGGGGFRESKFYRTYQGSGFTFKVLEKFLVNKF